MIINLPPLICQQTCALYGVCTCINNTQRNSMSTIHVLKRNGDKVVFDAEHVNTAVAWACEGVTGVDTSTVALHSSNQIFDGIQTTDIQKVLVKTAADMISEHTPNYDIVAGRLEIMDLRKEAYGSFTPPHLMLHISRLVELGLYDPELLSLWSPEELNQLDDALAHERDLNLRYAATQQYKGKYLVQNRTTKQIYESPQMTYMCASMALHQSEDKARRIQYVVDFYNATSLGKISLPTPIMGGVRTPTRQFASCTVVDCGDSLDSINSAANTIIKYISQRAGIGINGGAIRAVGSEIRRGMAVHTGKIPFFKHFLSAVKSCSQGYLLAV